MPATQTARGRPPIDPDGDTKALTVRLPAALKAELDTAAGRNGRSVSQEITARLGRQETEALTPLTQLVAAFEERLTLFTGSDWCDAHASTAMAEGLIDLLSRMSACAEAGHEDAVKTGHMVAELTFNWVCTRSDPESLALRAAFVGTAS